MSGQPVGELPPFGLTPCPLTLSTLGCLLLAQASSPIALWLIPVLWSLIGGSAAALLGIPQDWPLLVGGVAAAVLMIVRRRSEWREAATS